MKENYDSLLAQMEHAQRGRLREFKFDVDLKILLPQVTALPMLEKLMYERLSLSGGAVNLFSLMAQSYGNLNSALASRTQQIEELRLKKVKDPQELAAVYFGLSDEQGHTDTRFRDTVHAISLYTDDTLFFAMFLTNEMVKHATRLSDRGRKGFPQPVRPDFQMIADLGMLPPIGDHEVKLLNSLQIEPVLPIRPTVQENSIATSR